MAVLEDLTVAQLQDRVAQLFDRTVALRARDPLELLVDQTLELLRLVPVAQLPGPGQPRPLVRLLPPEEQP